MSRSNILLFTLAFLACLCSQSVALPQFGGALRNTIMNAHATSSGAIDLNKDSYNQFYVYADFSYYYGAQNSSKASNVTNSTGNSTGNSSSVGSEDYGRMMISTVNTDTMVASSCSNFNYYGCSSPRSCNKLSYTKSIDYPTFTANTQYAQSSIYLDYSYWYLRTSNYLYIANSCSAGSYNPSVGSGTYGVLGLGTGNGGSNNFGYSPIFSIYINSYLTGGKLLFKSDTNTYAQSTNSYSSFYASNTWQITTSSGYIQVGSYSVSYSGNVMFDMNSNAIGLPQNLYNSFLTYFGYLSNVYCYSGYNTRPYCYIRGKLSDLPDIYISISESQVKIPPAIYASSDSTSSSYTYFYLNFKATSTALSGENYVSPTFANSIILDAHFMSYYYTVFDASSGYNYIYLYPSINVGSNSPAAWFGSGAVLLIILISAICCCAKKKRIPTTVVATAAPLNNTTFNTTQAPLVYTQQPVNVNVTVPNYTYDANQYNNYPGYNTQQQPQGGVYQPYPNQGYVAPANYQ